MTIVSSLTTNDTCLRQVYVILVGVSGIISSCRHHYLNVFLFGTTLQTCVYVVHIGNRYILYL